MPMKLSTYIDDETIDAVKARSKPDVAFGSVYRDIAKRGFVVLALEVRALANLFTEPEWQVILDSFNGILTDPEFIPHITNNVEDNINLNDAGARFGLTAAQGRDLVARIKDLSAGAKWALLDTAERFWAAAERGEDISADADGLKKLGVVCYGETERTC